MHNVCLCYSMYYYNIKISFYKKLYKSEILNFMVTVAYDNVSGQSKH